MALPDRTEPTPLQKQIPAPNTYALTRKGLEVVLQAYGGRIYTREGVPQT